MAHEMAAMPSCTFNHLTSATFIIIVAANNSTAIGALDPHESFIAGGRLDVAISASTLKSLANTVIPSTSTPDAQCELAAGNDAQDEAMCDREGACWRHVTSILYHFVA